MTNSEIDQDGFRVVKTKRSKNKQTKIPAKVLQFQQEETDIDVEKAIR